MANENTYRNLKNEEREKAVVKEMLPFVIYAAVPIIITIIIAWTFGPAITDFWRR